MAKVSELVSQNIGNSIVNFRTWGSVIYNVTEAGATGNGTINDSAAIARSIADASLHGGIVFFKAGTYVTDNQVAPSNVTLWFANGAKLSINTGKAITINGYIEAGLYQIFSGTGTVVGDIKNNELYPEWWGALSDQSADASAAINACIATAQQNTWENIVKISPGVYLLTSTISVLHGGFPAALTIMGYGVRLVAGTANMTMMKVISRGSKASFENIGQTRIIGLSFYGGGSGTTGILLGKSSASANDAGLDGGAPSLIRDCMFENLQYGVIQSETRLFQYENCLFSLAPALSIAIHFKTEYGGFVGDSWITNCQLAVSTNGVCIAMRSGGTTGACNGIHINDCVFYGGGGIDITPTDNTSLVQDIWISNCAFDGTVSGTAINSLTNTRGNIGPIQINNCWINGYIYGITTYRGIGFNITGGKISSVDGEGVRFNDTTDCKVIGTLFVDVNRSNLANGVVKLTGSGLRNKIEMISVVNTVGSIVIIIDAGQDKFYIVGNSADAGTIVTNNAGGVDGTNHYIHGNL